MRTSLLDNRSLVLLACVLSTAGCGLRGPLYLPEAGEGTTQETGAPSDPETIRRTLERRPAPQAQKRDDAGQSQTPPPPTEPASGR